MSTLTTLAPRGILFGAAHAALDPRARAPLTLEALYASHARAVADVVFRLMGHDRDLDDLVQETFLDAAAELDGGAQAELGDGGDTPERPWLLMLAVRRVRRLLAKRRRSRIFGFRWLEATPAATNPRAEGPTMDLHDALAMLPEDLRIPFCLHRVEELTLPETARACEVSLATVKRRIKDAEVRLSRRLGA